MSANGHVGETAKGRRGERIIGRAKNSARPRIGLLYRLSAPVLSRGVGLALPKIPDQPERIVFVRPAMGEPDAQNGSKPARISVFSNRRPERAEFFALPIVGIAVSPLRPVDIPSTPD